MYALSGPHSVEVSDSDGAGHVLATAQRRLDLSVTVGALRYLDGTAVGLGQCVVLERRIAVSAAGVDGHVALGAGVGSHLILRLLFPRIGRGRDKCSTASLPSGAPVI
jgi:anti-sigma factor RsiW